MIGATVSLLQRVAMMILSKMLFPLRVLLVPLRGILPLHFGLLEFFLLPLPPTPLSVKFSSFFLFYFWGHN